jgi:hypothetical protein
MDDIHHTPREVPTMTDYPCRAYRLETYVAYATVRAGNPQQALEQLRQLESDGDLIFMDFCSAEPVNEFVVETADGTTTTAPQPAWCLYAQKALNDKLVETLRLALYALNEAPRFRVRHERYHTSYEVCAAVEETLRAAASHPVAGIDSSR